MDTSSEIAVARELGVPELRFFSRINYGGGAACATVQQAAMAVTTGVADVVVCYRGFNERSESRFGQFSLAAATQVNTNGLDNAWTYPMGLGTPAATVAMQARRYMHEYGATSEDFGQVAVADRRHAANNPDAFFFGKPITLEDHQASRMIVDPLHLLDCCQESDGGQALLVTTLERARDLRSTPAVIASAAQGSGDDQQMMQSYYRDTITGIPEMGLCAQQLWADTGLGAADIQTAVIYDHFTPLALPQLEEFGFCGRGEAKDFIKDGRIELGGALPINTHGGQLGEAYIHRMNGIAEGVRQVRGQAVNQVPDVEHVLVTAGTAVPTSALILGVDR
jgi:acetyl-CoA acetyltransferase